MSIKIAQNFDYKGRLPNFERDCIDSISMLSSINPDHYDDGHIVYCKENQLHYIFDKNNNFDKETGYFRIFKAESIGASNTQGIFQGDEAPKNTDLIWLDTSSEGFEDNEETATIESLQEAVRLLQTEVSSIKTLKTNGVVAGTVSNSTRVELATQGESIKPEIGLEIDEESTTQTPDYSDLEEVKPEYPDAMEPTVPHISIKMGTYSQLQSYIKNFIPGELLWCTNKKKLYIYINGSLVVVGSGDPDDEGGNNEGTTDMDTTEILNLINNQLQKVESIGFIPVGSTEPKYTVKVSKDGTLLCYDKTLDSWQPVPTNNYYFSDSVSHSGLLINSFYLGGDDDEHSYNPCSHNYVEISNVWMADKTAKQKDINLAGFYLLYLNPIKKKWNSLPLWGTIKANSTFVIRGSQCSVMDANTTVIKVKNYDMEWNELVKENPVYKKDENGDIMKDEQGNEIIDHYEPEYAPIKFARDSAVFYLAWGDPNADNNVIIDNEYKTAKELGKFYTLDSGDVSKLYKELPTDVNKLIDTNKGECAKGYIDLASFNWPGLCETTTYTLPENKSSKDVLFRRWYPMDPVGQSNPDDGITAHNNIKYLTSTYLDGSNWDDKIPVSDWTPKASWEGKSMRETRSLFLEYKPNTLTITFGIQASDNTLDSNGEGYNGRGAGRGFCWNSVGYYDEHLWIRKEEMTEVDGKDVGTGNWSDWVKVESIKENTLYTNDSNERSGGLKIVNSEDFGGMFIWPDSIAADDQGNSTVEYFTRNRWESCYGQVMTCHKVMLGGLKYGNYQYLVTRGTEEENGMPKSSYVSKLRNFTVKRDTKIKNFSYVHTTDQQGVTWEEWETWMLTARMMKKNYKKEMYLAQPGPTEEHDDYNLSSLHRYYADGRPEYNIKDVNGRIVYASDNENDSVEIISENTRYTVNYCTTDKSKASEKLYEIGTIPSDYNFVINTGDICYNGSRSNEWLEYFYAQENIDDREEMLCVGNNDLIPPTMRDIGTGQETPWKINPAVIDYFYAVDFSAENPPIFLGTSATNDEELVKFKIPGLYAWTFGEFHFICLLSEIRTISNKIAMSNGVFADKNIKQSTVNECWGVKDELRSPECKNASKIYDTVEGWIIKDLLYWKGATTKEINEYHKDRENPSNMNFDWQRARFDSKLVGECNTCIVYAHEMPFNITSSANYKNYQNNNNAPRETAKAYLNRYHNFEFQRSFKLWGIPMVMGGHKHTCAMTMPVYDAPDGYNPITKKMPDNYNNGYYKDKDGNSVNIGYYLGENIYDQIYHDTQIETVVEENKTYYKLNESGIFSQPASFRPIMQVTPDEFNTWGKDKLLPWTSEVYNNSSVSINVNGIELGPGEYTTELKASAAQAQNGSYPRCRVEIVDKITSPTYIMCQTSGFKNKSNSDLACASGDGIIPWERFYVPGDSIAEQCAPFYTVYDVITRDSAGKLLSEPRIEVNMYRVSGMYADSGGPKGGSPEGYWSLAKIYCHGENLEENREYFTGKGDEPGALSIQKYGGTTTIKLVMTE